ncbi:hypothetical protein Salat_0823400 [Sesamum alatum]|uniref:Secreted protein n=1 Tax=Sesamum alatum TaxID=300844 RepID=A0AAE1YV01_9LAMI|nr:hypothetical protein Salat_0823400 [Sesamum alatum]
MKLVVLLAPAFFLGATVQTKRSWSCGFWLWSGKCPKAIKRRRINLRTGTGSTSDDHVAYTSHVSNTEPLEPSTILRQELQEVSGRTEEFPASQLLYRVPLRCRRVSRVASIIKTRHVSLGL